MTPKKPGWKTQGNLLNGLRAVLGPIDPIPTPPNVLQALCGVLQRRFKPVSDPIFEPFRASTQLLPLS